MWLINLGMVLFVIGLMGCLVYPLRQTKSLALCVGLGAGVVSLVCLVQFGQLNLWKGYFEQQSKLQQAKQVLKKFKSKQEVITALQKKLNHTPQSAKGWYLLGRLYASEGDWLKASNAFKEASSLAPTETAYSVEYVISLWQLDDQHMTPEVRQRFQHILAKHPLQPEALMFLAMDAYQHHQKEKAVGYWQQLLTVVPEGSKDAVMIQEAIERAKRSD